MTAPTVVSATELLERERVAEEAFIAGQVKAPADTPPASATEKPPEAPAKEPTSEGAKPPVVSEPTGETQDPPNPEAVETPASEKAAKAEGDDEPEDIPDEAFEAAMAAERASLSIDSVPEEARPFVRKRIKELEGGFTRSMQKLAAERKEIAPIRAEARFQQEHPDDYIVTMLLAQPDLMERVNAKLADFEKTPMARDAHAIIVEKHRASAQKAEDDAFAAQEHQAKREAEITAWGKAAARAAGVPWEAGVEADIAAHLMISGDITQEQVKAIAADKARIWKKHVREVERKQANQYVQGKVEDRKHAGLMVKPATGAAPTPGAQPTPKNDDEFIAQFTAKLK